MTVAAVYAKVKLMRVSGQKTPPEVAPVVTEGGVASRCCAAVAAGSSANTDRDACWRFWACIRCIVVAVLTAGLTDGELTPMTPANPTLHNKPPSMNLPIE